MDINWLPAVYTPAIELTQIMITQVLDSQIRSVLVNKAVEDYDSGRIHTDASGGLMLTWISGFHYREIPVLHLEGSSRFSRHDSFSAVQNTHCA
jgi:hypothetical protein